MSRGFSRLSTAEVDVQNFALATHAVPAGRVRRHLPHRFELETFISESGQEMAFISSSTFCNRPIDHRHMDPWAGRLREGRFDFWEHIGVLEPGEAGDVFSVLVEPSVRFTLHPPRRAGV